MNKELACHEIALESAKAFVNSNMPEYVHVKGVKGCAIDMAQAYIDAYNAAQSVFNDPKNISKARIH